MATSDLRKMNKLKKTGPTASRTMLIAKVAAVANNSPQTFQAKTPFPPRGTDAQPITATEQYWAARALTAEALLSVKHMHQKELTSLANEAEAKRTREVTKLRHIHESRQSKLEMAVVCLSATLIGLLVVTVYGLFSHSEVKPKSSPMHFTIPILSPFASVVEHETSVMSSRTLTIFAVIAAASLYGCFRYWLSHRSTR